jgi:iron complex outermembrane receptor protein
LHNGYSELDQLFPNAIGTMTVYKGNSDPRYGLLNVAGNYMIQTRTDVAREVHLTAGSFEAKEIQGYFGEQTGALRHNYFVGYRQSEGYRDNFDIDKYSVSGRWFYDFSPSTTLGFIARAAAYDADAPGYLTREEARNHPTRSADYASQDGGDKHTQSYSVHLDHAFTDNLDWQVKGYFNHYDRERWVQFSEGGSLQNRYDDQDHYGLTSTLSWQLVSDWTMNWGVNVEKQEVTEQRFGTLGSVRQRDTSTVTRNHSFDFITYGSYIELANTPVDWFEWNAALRADRLTGEGKFSSGTNTAQTKQKLYDFGTIIQPKLNVFIYPLDTVTVFANYGRSFQAPTGSAAYTSGDRSARDVSLNDGWELGTKWLPIDQLELRLSYWEQRASDEYVNVDGTSLNVGKTNRQGVDFGFNWDVTGTVNLWGNFTTVDSEILSEGAVYGNELRSIPDYTASVGVGVDVTPKLTWRLHLDSQGGSYVNEENQGGKFGRYNLVNTSVDYDAGWGTVNLQVNNLFDQYYEYVYDFGSDASNMIHSPGDGINASVSVSYNF